MKTIYFTLVHCTNEESESILMKLTPWHMVRITMPYYHFSLILGSVGAV